jgi:hypothetical protein
VDSEALIELREWLEVECRESLPETIATHYGFTSALWTFVETVPFPETGPTAIEDRILRIHRAAPLQVGRSASWPWRATAAVMARGHSFVSTSSGPARDGCS